VKFKTCCVFFQYFITDADVGKNRAEVSAPQVSELNPYVEVSPHTGDLTDDFLMQFKVSTRLQVMQPYG